MTRAKTPGFTLIELLVAVAIFSGIVVLTLAAFARSADSSIRSSLIRERTEAARTIVDRIGNDMQYVYTGQAFNSSPNDCTNGALSLGVNFDQDCLLLLLKYPGSSNSQLVLHKYVMATANGRTAIKLEEASDCSISAAPQLALSCNPPRTGVVSDIISDKFRVIDQPIFSGIDPQTAQTTNVTPLISVAVTVSPVTFTVACSTDPTNCYSINSSFVPGG